MLLTLTTTHAPATDLGYLLHKHPGKVQSYDLPFGKAHVFYPEATTERCTAALALDVDPVGLVRGKQHRRSESDAQYVSDRPYVASSFLSTAIAQVYGSALNGRSGERPELVAMAFPFRARLAVVPCHGGEAVLRRLFEPLGYQVAAERHKLDEQFPSWGESIYYTVELAGEVRLQDLLTHLYVLIPVLDDDKHYWVGADEVDKLLRRGEGWLGSHPEREVIADRYLARQRRFTREALARLAGEEAPDPDAEAQTHATEEEAVERPLRLGEARIAAVLAVLDEAGPKRVVDLGCGEGRLLHALLPNMRYERVLGVDVSHRSLERAGERLHLERMSASQRARVELIHGSLTYRDRRIEGFDAAAAVEVVEHLDAERLRAFERVVFECARPRTVVLTTPNVEYNAKFPDLPNGRLRHRDHRFEWTRSEFRDWAEGVAQRFNYSVRYVPVGEVDPDLGPPTQMGVFSQQ